MGFLTIATIRSDRIKSWKRGRVAHLYRTDFKSVVSALRWYDNKCIKMCFNYSDLAPTSTIKKWDRKKHQESEISCSSIVAEYNTYMGGVDFSDMLISLYPTKCKTRCWYLKIMSHYIDIYIKRMHGWSTKDNVHKRKSLKINNLACLNLFTK